MPKGYKYSGTHWTQKPENKDKVRKMAAKRASMRRMASRIVRNVKSNKRGPYKPRKQDATSFVLKGFRITFSGNEIRIENE